MAASNRHYDYIVVGAGTAGCVVAARLSQAQGARVLLLEAGGTDDHEHIRSPRVPHLFQTWADARITRNYQARQSTGAMPDWPEVPWMDMPRGIVRGGTASINGAVYIRGNPRDFDLWAEAGNPGWSYQDVLPAFKRAEQFNGAADAFHGADGPMHVRTLDTPTEPALAFCEAALSHGFEGPNWDFNGTRQEGGAGLYQFTMQADGRRVSSASAYLDGLAPAGVTERLRATACRIEFDGRRARGVQCLVGDANDSFRSSVGRTFYADQEIIICAGAYESPKLLMLSGLGPRQHLRDRGIQPRFHLPGVGQNLLDHLILPMYFKAKPGLRESTVTAECGLFTHSSLTPASMPPDLQFHVSGRIDHFTPETMTGDNFLMGPTLLQPRSRGYIQLLSDDPRHPPDIVPHFLRHADDVRILSEGVELAREIARCQPLAELNEGELSPGADVRGAALEQHIRDTYNIVWHPVGTCRMGRDDFAVVDSELRVYGTEGLRVADASVMPTIPAGNTSAPSVMVGEKAAELILTAA